MKLIYSSFLIFLLFSCVSTEDNPDVCIQYRTAGIESAAANLTADATGKTFDVAFRVSDGCGAFYSFQENTVGTVTTIKVLAKYEGCFCTQVAPLLETVYIFNQTAPGTYTLNFIKGDGTFFTETVVIP